jgi:hypothetical protein
MRGSLKNLIIPEPAMRIWPPLMKKVSSNLNRLSKQQKPPIRKARKIATAITSAWPARAASVGARARTKADTQMNKLVKTNLDREAKERRPRWQPRSLKDRIEDGFKKEKLLQHLEDQLQGACRKEAGGHSWHRPSCSRRRRWSRRCPTECSR